MSKPFAQLLYTKEELEALGNAVAQALRNEEQILEVARSREVRTSSRERWNLLNSLRTSLAEARYGLMTLKEIQDEERLRRELGQ